MLTAAIAAGLLCAQAQEPTGQEPLQDLLQQASRALADHRYDDAARGFEEAIAAQPRLAAAHANLGVARYLLGDFDRASSAFRHAHEISPSMPNAELYLGLSEARAGRVNSAMGPLSRGFWNASDDPWRLQSGILLAELYAARGNHDQLVRVVGALRKAFPDNSEVLYLAYRLHSDLAAEALAGLVREAPNSARLHQVTAELLVSEGDFPRAVRQYRQALSIDAKLSGANRALAVAILNSDPDEALTAEAEEALERELRLNPRDAESLYQLGEIAWRRGQQEAALERYRSAVEMGPQFAEGRIALGKALLAVGEPEIAADHLETAVRIDPENETARYRLAQAYRQLGRIEEAAEELRQFQRIRSTSESLSAIYRQVQRGTASAGAPDTRSSK